MKTTCEIWDREMHKFTHTNHLDFYFPSVLLLSPSLALSVARSRALCVVVRCRGTRVFVEGRGNPCSLLLQLITLLTLTSSRKSSCVMFVLGAPKEKPGEIYEPFQLHQSNVRLLELRQSVKCQVTEITVITSLVYYVPK